MLTAPNSVPVDKQDPDVTAKLERERYGNRVVEFDPQGRVVWELKNDDVQGIVKDTCGVQRLPNGNTVVTNYGQREKDAVKIFEVTPSKKIVWIYKGHRAHHFQILTTNGKPIAGLPMK